MKTNNFIYNRIKSRKTKFSFDIEDVSNISTLANFYRPYGDIYVPIPIPVFPVNESITFKVGPDVIEKRGLPFKVEIEEGFNVASDTYLQIMISGDELCRTIYEGIFETQLLNIEGRVFETQDWIKLIDAKWSYELEEYTSFQLIVILSSVKFWRCRLKVIGTNGVYYGAWSSTASFTLEFATGNDMNIQLYPSGSDTTEVGHYLDSKGIYY